MAAFVMVDNVSSKEINRWECGDVLLGGRSSVSAVFCTDTGWSSEILYPPRWWICPSLYGLPPLCWIYLCPPCGELYAGFSGRFWHPREGSGIPSGRILINCPHTLAQMAFLVAAVVFVAVSWAPSFTLLPSQ